MALRALFLLAAASVAFACVTPDADCDQNLLTAFPSSQVSYAISEDFAFGSSGPNARHKAVEPLERPSKRRGPTGETASATAAAAPAANVATAEGEAAAPQANKVDATGSVSLENTGSLQFPAGIDAFPTDCCQSFFNVLSAYSWYTSNDVSADLQCLNRINSITFSFDDTRKHSVSFEVKSSKEGWNFGSLLGAYNGFQSQYSMNTATSQSHPYITPYSRVGIDSFVMGTTKYNVNQRTVLQPAVFDETTIQNNFYGGGGCNRVRHHSFWIEGRDLSNLLFYIEVVVQETTVPF